jgi:kynureninase
MAGGDLVTDLSRAAAEALDAADPLARFRDRFVITDPGLLYVDGNSLGRLPAATRERVAAAVDDWGARMVSGWPDWIELPEQVGDRLGRAVLGAGPGEALVCDSTTVNLYKLASAALDVREGAIVVDADDFPTDRYVLAGLARANHRELRLMRTDPVAGPSPDDVARACAGGPVALVCLSLVGYRSGALGDVPAIADEAHAGGGLMLWDLSHAAGSVPVHLGRDGADLAVGCTYKYLNAGPGAPAFLWARRGLVDELGSPIQGWFGQREQFAMGPEYDPQPGIARFAAGTPPIAGIVAVDEGVRLAEEAGIDALWAKAQGLTGLAVELHDAWLTPLGFSLGSPRDAVQRGAHVALRHPDAWRICRALIEHARVVPDFREPDSVRLGLPPLYTRFVDVWDALDRLRSLVTAGTHRTVAATRSRVT